MPTRRRFEPGAASSPSRPKTLTHLRPLDHPSYKIGKSRAKIYSKNITKRCLKNFSESSWNQCLATKNWSSFEVSSDLNEMVKTFEDNIKEALDEIAPIKNIKIKSSYKFGLSDKAKELMKARDLTRNKIKNCEKNEKEVLNQKYRTLRNKVTSQIRKDNIDHNNNKNCESLYQLKKLTRIYVKTLPV